MKMAIAKVVALMSLCLTTQLPTSAMAAEDAPGRTRQMHMIVWGASGLQSVSRMLPDMLKEDGVDLNVRVLSGHTRNFAIAAKAAEAGKRAPEGVNDPGDLPNKGADYGYVNLERDRSIQVHLEDEFSSRPWNIVLLVINTHYHVEKEPYKWLDTLYTFSRKRCPNAKMVLLQRPSPPNDSMRKIPAAEKKLKAFGDIGSDEVLTATKWTLISSRRQQEWAARHPDVLQVLAGDVTEWARRDSEWGFPPLPNHIEAKAYYESLVDSKQPSRYPNDRRFCIGYRPKDDGYNVDHHPNVFGSYIMAATFYEIVFGANVMENTYVPARRNASLRTKDVAILQRIVHETIHDADKIPLYQ
jgi:hypothetical protein